MPIAYDARDHEGERLAVFQQVWDKIAPRLQTWVRGQA
ncbi:hypothetical protein HNQ08_001553 [Deinococcus humi]|uniref:Uncharacterized protein n=1 Tax=Deinococcus humi TaxID=662880 RepID=A0A7W8NF61_9DEIO|nr:hypothetical protein [Deinococcus humi]